MVLGIYGAGGLGREVLELAKIINKQDGRWEDIIFVIDGKSCEVINGTKVYDYNDALEIFDGNLEICMGIGEPATRERLFGKLEKDGINTPTLIHPDVYIPDTTTVGKGVIIQYGCFISCNAEIGDYVFMQPQSGIGHDDKLSEGVVISSMTTLAGGVSVGKYTYLGLAVAVKEGISIGDYSIVGMYSAVHKDIESEMLVMGNPARPVRRNDARKVFG